MTSDTGVATILGFERKSEKDQPNGYAGLDSSGLPALDSRYVGLDSGFSSAYQREALEVLQTHFENGIIDNIHTTAATAPGTLALNVASHKIEFKTVNAAGVSWLRTNMAWVLDTYPLYGTYKVHDVVNGTGTNFKTLVGFAPLNPNANGSYACFQQKADHSWIALTQVGGSKTETAVTIVNGDTLQVVATSASVKFFINRVLVATHTSSLPTGAMYSTVFLADNSVIASDSREMSLDLEIIRKI